MPRISTFKWFLWSSYLVSEYKYSQSSLANKNVLITFIFNGASMYLKMATSIFQKNHLSWFFFLNLIIFLDRFLRTQPWKNLFFGFLHMNCGSLVVQGWIYLLIISYTKPNLNLMSPYLAGNLQKFTTRPFQSEQNCIYNYFNPKLVN